MFRSALLLSVSIPTLALADVPRVITDIAPVHSLVAQVMGDLGKADLLVSGNASPHGFSLRPSQAADLEQADIVFWVGEELTPWLHPMLERLAPNAVQKELLHSAGTKGLEFRDGDNFEKHDHDHGHEDEHAHDEHGEDGEVDPHAWLDPENAKAWINTIAQQISALDPENESTYRQNAKAAAENLTGLITEIKATLAPVKDKNFIVFHDAYHYFEARFDHEAIAAISLGDASKPGPARVEKIQDIVRTSNVSCAFSEPQFSEGLVLTVLEGTDANIAVLDPIGATITPGPEFYDTLLRNMAQAIADC